MAQIEGIRTNNGRRGKYHKPRREIAQKEIRHLIVDEGLTNRQISERLNIPQKTVERYIADLYAHDNEILSSLRAGDDTVLTRWNIVRDRMDHHRQEILETIAHNPDTSAKDKIAAWHIICELEAADLRLTESSVEMVARRSALSYKNNPLVAKGSNVVNLKLLKEEEEEEEQEE